MITSKDFYRVIYSKPKLFDDRPTMSKVIGIDSEAYTTGEPFMFCTSLGDVLKPEQLPDILFTPKYESANFMIYNIKYDSGALLYHLPKEQLRILWEDGELTYNDYTYRYIPHKQLRIIKGDSRVDFWDISQFYKSSLDKAARKYIHRKKLEIRTKKFTRKYVARFHKAIARYCIQDAVLTHKLGNFLIKKLASFDISAVTLYSCASVSFKYFCDNSKVITCYRLWKTDKQALALAVDAYEGGKFEMTQKGSFHAFEYDISSAYPYEIRNLIDISHAKIVHSPAYHKDATYGFLRVYIRNTGKHLPCGIMPKNLRYYPSGAYYVTITKEEYEYIISLDIHIDILQAVWFFVDKISYPYRDTIDNLFNIKKAHKGKDMMVYNTSKIIMNSFYGKCLQSVEQKDGTVKVGAGWNPVYASVITANTRIKVTRLQNEMQSDCIAVHTDSVITKKPIPDHYIVNELGGFEYVTDGPAMMIACGMYQIGDDVRYRGLKLTRKYSWFDVLSRNKSKTKIPIRQLHVESWVEASAKNHDHDKINVFEMDEKEIDLNCDRKRVWQKKHTGRDLLSGPHFSTPIIHVENSPPNFWK